MDLDPPMDPDPPLYLVLPIDLFQLILYEITLLDLILDMCISKKEPIPMVGSDSSMDPDPGNSNSGSLGYDSGSGSTKKWICNNSRGAVLKIL